MAANRMDDKVSGTSIRQTGDKRKRRQEIGQAGEAAAVTYLRQAGLTVICRNYRCPRGEMDVIALDGSQLVFIEVRTRTSATRGWGEESITSAKRNRLHTVATYYLLANNYNDWPSLRFDILALRWTGLKPEIFWFKAI